MVYSFQEPRSQFLMHLHSATNNLICPLVLHHDLALVICITSAICEPCSLLFYIIRENLPNLWTQPELIYVNLHNLWTHPELIRENLHNLWTHPELIRVICVICGPNLN